jgi:hypothetical protein
MGCLCPIAPSRGKRKREKPAKLYSPFPLTSLAKQETQLVRISFNSEHMQIILLKGRTVKIQEQLQGKKNTP